MPAPSEKCSGAGISRGGAEDYDAPAPVAAPETTASYELERKLSSPDQKVVSTRIHRAKIGPNFQNRCSKGSNSTGARRSDQRGRNPLVPQTISYMEGRWFGYSRSSPGRAILLLQPLGCEPAVDSFGDCLPSGLKHHDVALLSLSSSSASAISAAPSRRAPSASGSAPSRLTR